MERFRLCVQKRLARFFSRWFVCWRSVLGRLGVRILRYSLVLSFLLPNFLCFAPAAFAAVDGAGGSTVSVPVELETELDSQNLTTPFVDFSSYDSSNTSNFFRWIKTTDASSMFALSGEIGIYLSFYCVAGSYDFTVPSGYTNVASYKGLYRNHNGTLGDLPLSLTTFTPNDTSSHKTTGVRLSGKTFADSSAPISYLEISCPSYATVAPHTSRSCSQYFRVPSCTIVATQKSGDLAALEGIADSIVQQSEVLSAMYGDIMQVLNSIYQQTDDMLEAQYLANMYFSQIVDVLGSLNTTTSNIYSLLGTQFSLLISTINSGVVDIKDAISAAELRIEEYFKPVIDYYNSLQDATGESPDSLPGHKEDLDNAVSSGAGLDGDAQEGFSSVFYFITQFDLLLVYVGIWLGAGIFLLVIKKGLS